MRRGPDTSYACWPAIDRSPPCRLGQAAPLGLDTASTVHDGFHVSDLRVRLGQIGNRQPSARLHAVKQRAKGGDGALSPQVIEQACGVDQVGGRALNTA